MELQDVNTLAYYINIHQDHDLHATRLQMNNLSSREEELKKAIDKMVHSNINFEKENVNGTKMEKIFPFIKEMFFLFTNTFHNKFWGKTIIQQR